MLQAGVGDLRAAHVQRFQLLPALQMRQALVDDMLLSATEDRSHRFVRYSDHEGERVSGSCSGSPAGRGVRFRYEASLGKGSHGRVWLETLSTTLKDPKKELGPGLLRAMCRDLEIEPGDL